MVVTAAGGGEVLIGLIGSPLVDVTALVAAVKVVGPIKQRKRRERNQLRQVGVSKAVGLSSLGCCGRLRVHEEVSSEMQKMSCPKHVLINEQPVDLVGLAGNTYKEGTRRIDN